MHGEVQEVVSVHFVEVLHIRTCLSMRKVQKREIGSATLPYPCLIADGLCLWPKSPSHPLAEKG